MPKEPGARRSIEGRSIPVWLLINVVGVLLGFVLFIAAFGVAGGFLLAVPVAQESSKSLVQELTPEQRDALVNLKPEEIEALILRGKDLTPALLAKTRQVNWLIILPIMNAIAFAGVGFLVGLFRVFRYVALIPVALLPITVPMMLNSEFFASAQNYQLAALVSVFTQFVSVYLFAYIGRWIRSPAREEPYQT